MALAARLIDGLVSHSRVRPERLYVHEDWNRCSYPTPDQYFGYRCKYQCKCSVVGQVVGVDVQQLVGVQVQAEDVVVVYYCV